MLPIVRAPLLGRQRFRDPRVAIRAREIQAEDDLGALVALPTPFFFGQIAGEPRSGPIAAAPPPEL